MKKRLSAFFVICTWLLLAFGCSAGPPSITSVKFETGGTPPTTGTSFTVGDDIYAVIIVSNLKEKLKVKCVFTAENVEGATKGQVLLDNTTDIPRGQVRLNYLGLTKPGEFKETVTLMDDAGKVLDTRSGTFTLNPKAPATTNSDPGNAVNKALKTLENLKPKTGNQNSH